MGTVRTYKVFLSSPSDVREDVHQLKSRIEAFKTPWRRNRDISLEVVMFEGITPQIGVEPQAVINSHLEECNIYIGVMGAHFGTTNGEGQSGTEEEYEVALQKSKNGEMKGAFYFKESFVGSNDSRDKQLQFARVQEFKNKISSETFFRDYSEVADFIDEAIGYIDDCIKSDEPVLAENSKIKSFLEDRWEKTLQTYKSLPSLWVDRNISDKPENLVVKDGDSSIETDASKFLADKSDKILKAPPQFGMSALAAKLAFDEWMIRGKFVLCLQSDELKDYQAKIEERIESILNSLDASKTDLSAIMLDTQSIETDKRKIKNIKTAFPDIPLIIMFTAADNKQLNFRPELEHEFTEQFLCQLDIHQIRAVVEKYGEKNQLKFDDDEVVQKIVTESNNLNLHRTPLNILQLLKVYEDNTSQMVNRGEVLECFLQLVFLNYKKDRNYSAVPDVKDAFLFFGRFCAKLYKERIDTFTKSDFIEFSNSICEEFSTSTDVKALFDVLEEERIITPCSGRAYKFRYVHWIHFFVARQMTIDEEYKFQILSAEDIFRFPDIIEFYAGSDRSKDDLVGLLIEKLSFMNQDFHIRTRIENDFNPLEEITCNIDDNKINQWSERVSSQVQSSSLPKEVKDQMADRDHKNSKPYSQELEKYYLDSTLSESLLVMDSAARALRNSDYVQKGLKLELLNQILLVLKNSVQIIALFSPTFAEENKFVREGLAFRLDESFDELDEEGKLKAIIVSIPDNVLRVYSQGLVTDRLGKLFSEYQDEEADNICKFLAVACVIRDRPRWVDRNKEESWGDIVIKFIDTQPKGSFYLGKISEYLEFQQRYGFLKNQEEEEYLVSIEAATFARLLKGSSNRKPQNRIRRNIKDFLSKNSKT